MADTKKKPAEAEKKDPKKEKKDEEKEQQDLVSVFKYRTVNIQTLERLRCVLYVEKCL